jgi:iron uptake system component EfeO
MIFSIMVVVTVAVGSSSCGTAPTDPKNQALISVKSFIQANMIDLADSSAELQMAAPASDADGWNAAADPGAVSAMKAAWKRARVAYEHIEGAIAVLFPELDYSTDQRYDAFLADNGPDSNLFDDQNVTGIHAIERILWSAQVPARVQIFEQALPGFHPAAFPSSGQEADDFKNKLCALLVADVKSMRDQFGPLALDTGAAFRGVIGSMGEQLEKVELAATGEEESRYAGHTLADMRANVDAGVKTFEAFKPWLKSKGAEHQLQEIGGGFDRVNAAYAVLAGDALPPVPATWSSQQPTAVDLQTPFGLLWSVLRAEADPDTDGTLVFEMNEAAQILGIPL